MKLNMDISKYVVPFLGTGCAAGILLVASGMRVPAGLDTAEKADAEVRIPDSLVLDGYVPTMEEVVAKHLFVPERKATGENAFPDLLVKGVYIGETQHNAVLSLKSKPNANLRVWQGDEDAAISQVVDEKDPRKPIAEFLGEWEVKAIDFSGMTVRHIITGEVETYTVDYSPAKHVKDSAGNGYGQGMLVDEAAGKAAPAARPNAPAQPAQARAPAGGAQAIAGRVGQYMQRLSPEQRQQFMQQLQKQNAATARKNGGAAQQSKGGAAAKKNSAEAQRGGRRTR